MDLDLNEYRTRKEKIDIFLEEQGWAVSKGNVVEEVDTLQSDFKKKDYKKHSETYEQMLEKAVMLTTLYWTIKDTHVLL